MTTAAKVGITGIDASYYLTKDLGRSTTFYSGLFGAEPSLHIPQTISEWTFAGGETFGLYQPQEASEWHPGGGVLFHVADLAAARAASESLGARFESHPEETPMCHMAFGQDPEGNNFILHQPK
jgi:predicted enzyme related to lactoylglutathione lyase